jgi:hypothetical protein
MTTLDKILPSDRTIATPVSSQEVSIPRTTKDFRTSGNPDNGRPDKLAGALFVGETGGYVADFVDILAVALENNLCFLEIEKQTPWFQLQNKRRLRHNCPPF